MYEYLKNPKYVTRILDASLIVQIITYGVLSVMLYHVRNLDPAIATGWSDNLSTPCLVFIILGAFDVLLLVLWFMQAERKNAILRVHRIILIIVVLTLIIAGHAVVSWVSVHSGAYDGAWPFIQL